ncbi:hypothetical protein MLD38_018236 [Melastoma candidum]|uniref:Uncharacterized protein n=1 Tax=Melastoma candidum TaxID=119954 RepID=A0ACB9QT80_9MYRT|nr:hypothetical protein MLD38_018236 [Melastoma candidum]
MAALMNPFILSCLAISLFPGSLFVLANDVGSGPCNTDLAALLPPPYGNASHLTCLPVWNSFVLRYHQSRDHTLTVVLSALYTTGWVGIGLSRDGLMVGSSAIVGWFNKKGQPRILQYYLQGNVPRQVIPNKGELPLSGAPPAIALYEATLYIAFQLKLSKPLARQSVILALATSYPKYHRLTHHVDSKSINVDFLAGAVSEGSKYVRERKRAHGALGMLGWGLILPAGSMVARYLRHKDPQWYYIHTITQFGGFIIGLAGVVVGVQLYNDVGPDIPAHRGIGIFVLTLTILQVLAFFLRPNKESQIRRYWNWYHSWVGRVTLLFAAINIVLGIQAGHAGNAWKIGYGFLVSVTIIVFLVSETLFWMRRPGDKAQATQSFQMNPIEQALPGKVGYHASDLGSIA